MPCAALVYTTMAGRKREKSLAEEELCQGRLLRLITSSKDDVFLQLFDGNRRVQHARISRMATEDDCISWASQQLSKWGVTEMLSSGISSALCRAVRARRPNEDDVNESQAWPPGSLEHAEQNNRPHYVQSTVDDHALNIDELAVFNELGKDVGPIAAACAAATRSSSIDQVASMGECELLHHEAQLATKRARTSVDRFDPVLAERGRGGWSPYDLGRIGHRHACVREESYSELRVEAHELRKQMDSLRNLMSMPDRNFNAVLERIAAVLLHQAAANEEVTVPADGVLIREAEVSGNAIDEGTVIGAENYGGGGSCSKGTAQSNMATSLVETTTTGSSAVTDSEVVDGASGMSSALPPLETAIFSNVTCRGTACKVEIRPRGLHIVSKSGDGGQWASLEGVPQLVAFELITGVTSSQTSNQMASCLIQLASVAEPLTISFQAHSAFDCVQRTHIRGRDKFMGTLQSALATATAHNQLKAKEPAQESSRIRKGRELRELLKQVSKLHSAHKVRDANALFDSALPGSDGSEAIVKKRAQQLRAELFTYGGLELTRRILADFLNLCEVRLILPEHTREAIQVAKDAKTAFELLGAAGNFIHRVIGSKGRRTDEDRNAFWASVVSLMPRDLRQNRKVASAMRLLKVCTRASVRIHLNFGQLSPFAIVTYRYHAGSSMKQSESGVMSRTVQVVGNASRPTATGTKLMGLSLQKHGTASSSHVRTIRISRRMPYIVENVMTAMKNMTCTSAVRNMAVTRMLCKGSEAQSLRPSYVKPRKLVVDQMVLEGASSC